MPSASFVGLVFVQGDMREMSFDGAFDAVVSWGTSFGYFDDDANRALVERFHLANDKMLLAS